MTSGLAGWLGLVFLGVALLWIVQISLRGTGRSNNSRTTSLLTTSSWLLIFLGIAGPISVAGGFVLALFGLLFMRMCVYRFREAEYLSLLWLVGSSVRHGMPLAIVARDFASERCDQVGVRCERFADLLERGMSFPDALKGARIQVPTEALLASEFRDDPAVMGASLQSAARQSSELLPQVNAALHRLMYLMLVCLVAIGLMAFVFLKIVPTINQLLMDFEVERPATLEWLIWLANLVANYGFLTLPMAWLLCSLFVLLLIGYAGVRLELPFLRPITKRFHAAVFMRALANQLRFGKSLSQAFELLAAKYPTRFVRARLRLVEEDISKGENWTNSLVAHRLLTQSAAAVLHAAQRTGNLIWALEEMAETSARRMHDRVSLALRVLMPFVVILVALPIAALAIGIFVPLVRMIESFACAV